MFTDVTSSERVSSSASKPAPRPKPRAKKTASIAAGVDSKRDEPQSIATEDILKYILENEQNESGPLDLF